MTEFQKELFKRLTVSSIVVVLLTAILMFAYIPFFSVIVFFVISLLGIVATLEIVSMSKDEGLIFKKLLIAFSCLCILSFYMAGLGFVPQKITALILFAAFLSIFLAHFKRVEHAIKDVALNLFFLVYITVPLGMLIYILYSRQGELYGIDGRMWVVIIIALTKISDIFAYFFGKLMGKHKLLLKISPNKTIEGSIAGLSASIMLAVVFQNIFSGFAHSYLEAAIVGLAVGVLSQIGDLCESLLKRDAKVKDSSTIPGLGGILDLLDSILITTPFFYFYLGI